MQEEKSSGFPVAFLAGAGIMALLLGGLYFWTQPSGTEAPHAPPRLPMGAAEQAYAARIQFLEIKMSRAANFLNQEVTFLFGTVSNEGNRTLRDMEVTVEFRDLLNQLVLRETQRLFGARPAPLPGGQRREFQLTFERVPADWNRQYPSLRITGLLLD